MAITSILPKAKRQTTSLLQTGMTYDVNGTQFPLQQGVPQRSIYMFEIVPCPPSANSLSLSNDSTGVAVTGFQPLKTTDTLSGTGTSNVASTYDVYNGVPTIFFDVEQAPGIYLGAGSGVQENCTVIFTGIDYRGIPVTATIDVPEGTAANTSLFASTAMAGVQYVYVSGTLGTSENPQAATFGGSRYFGLPYYLASIANVLSFGYRNVNDNTGALYSGANINTYITPGHNWRNAAPSSTTNARGFIYDSGNVAAGNEAFMLSYYINGGDSELNNLLQNFNFSSTTPNNDYGLNAVATLGCVLTDSGSQYAYSRLFSADLTGLQYASNSTTSIGSVSTTSPDSIFYTNYASFIANN